MELSDRDQKSDGVISPVAECCTVCQDMKTVLTESAGLLKFGFLDEVMESPCHVLVEMVSHLTELDQSCCNEDNFLTAEISMGKLNNAVGGRLYMYSNDMPLISHDYLLVDSSTDTPALGSGRNLDSDWVDVEVLRS